MAYRPPTITYHPDKDEPLTVAVISALSAAMNQDFYESECVLYENIDPDLLESLFNDKRQNDPEIAFTACGKRVQIRHRKKTLIEVKDVSSRS